jgi:hypothetical protein
MKISYPKSSSLCTAVIPTALLDSLVVGSMLLTSPMVLAKDAKNEKDISPDASHLLKDLRSAADELNALRLDQLNNARLLAELIAAKRTLSDLSLTEPPPSTRLPEKAVHLCPRKKHKVSLLNS